MPREYSSPLREQQALQTRLAIIGAAHRLFVTGGYSETTIRAIAEEAGVAERTVYAAFGDKISIVTAVAGHVYWGGTDQDEGHETHLDQLREIAEPLERLRRSVHLSAVGKEQGLALIARMIRSAALSDPRLEEWVGSMVEWRHRQMRRGAEVILGRELAGEAYDQLIDELEAINSEETYLLLVVERGWSREKYEQYVVDMCIAACERHGLELA
ncbi:MAG: helix-turn-helix domain-containing protein [Acidimicrobiia bacterium]